MGYQNPGKALADHIDPEDKLNGKTALSLDQRGGWLINENGNILFCGNDVARALGYARPIEAVASHARGTVKRRTPTKSREQMMP